MGWATTGFFQPNTAAFEVGSFERTAAHAAAKWLGGTVVGLASPSVSLAVQAAYFAVRVAYFAVRAAYFADQVAYFAVQVAYLAVQAVDLAVQAVGLAVQEVDLVDQADGPAVQAVGLAVWADPWLGQVEEVVLVVVAVQAEYRDVQFDHQVVLTAVQAVRDDHQTARVDLEGHQDDLVDQAVPV